MRAGGAPVVTDSSPPLRRVTELSSVGRAHRNGKGDDVILDRTTAAFVDEINRKGGRVARSQTEISSAVKAPEVPLWKERRGKREW